MNWRKCVQNHTHMSRIQPHHPLIIIIIIIIIMESWNTKNIAFQTKKSSTYHVFVQQPINLEKLNFCLKEKPTNPQKSHVNLNLQLLYCLRKKLKICYIPYLTWLVVEPTHLKNISQIDNLAQVGIKIKTCLKPPSYVIDWIILRLNFSTMTMK